MGRDQRGHRALRTSRRCAWPGRFWWQRRPGQIQHALEDRLLELLRKVQSVEDALHVEVQLTRVRTEIERLDAQRQGMKNRVAFATIELVVTSPVQRSQITAETVTSRLERALDDAGRTFVATIAGLVRLFGALLPLGLVFGPIVLVIQRGVRRRRGRV